MGQTWSEPILTKIRVKVNGDDNEGKGYERWVAIFAGGYDPSGDPNIFTAYDANATKGRAILIVDIKTGELLASKQFDPGAPVGDPQSEMRFAIPSTPGVYDLDFDGYADVIYVGDLGGNVWKWVIHPIGEDRVNDGSGLTTQPNWPFKKFFEAPTYQEKAGEPIYHKSFFFPPGATFKNRTLWLALGTGERTNLKFMGDDSTAEDNNRFYAMTDLDPLEQAVAPYATLAESDLSDVTNDESCVSLTDRAGLLLRRRTRERSSSPTSTSSSTTSSSAPTFRRRPWIPARPEASARSTSSRSTAERGSSGARRIRSGIWTWAPGCPPIRGSPSEPMATRRTG